MPVPRLTYRWLLAGLMFLGLLGCQDEPDDRLVSLADLAAPGSLAGHDVLLITLDTTRPDHLGCYGDGMAVTPALDGLAARGVLVADAVTPAPLTLPAHASLLTGLDPPRHGVRDNGRYRLARDGARTLAEQLRDVGYTTAAFVSCFVLDQRFGLDRGFDHYDFAVTAAGYQPHKPDFNERDATAVTDAALAWLADHTVSPVRSPYFLWVHYFDPHLPYRSPLAARPEFAGRPYDAEIAHMDAQIGRLLATLDERRLRNRTLIIVAGDHGEGLGEHGEATHGLFVYDSTVKVPLILAAPAWGDQPRVLDGRVVSLIDIRPTLEDLLGLPHQEPCDGQSLLMPSDPDRAVYLETMMPWHLAGWSPLHALRTHDAKSIAAPRPEYYELRRDPTEQHNRRDEDPRAGTALADRLAAVMASHDASPVPTRTVSEEEARRLGSLGYVQGSARQDDTPADPKEMAPVLAAIMEAEAAAAAGRHVQAVAIARAGLARSPGLAPLIRIVAFGLHHRGKTEEAFSVLRRATASEDDPYLLRAHAQLAILGGRFAEAREVLERYAAAAPDDGRVALLRGDICAREGNLADARVQYEEALARDEGRCGYAARERLARLGDARTADD